MNYGKTFFRLFLAAILGMAAVPAGAEVFFQCPTLGGSFADLDGDGMIRADTIVNVGGVPTPEIVNPVSPRQVCMHLVAGDGFVNMADKTVNHGDGPGLGKLQYIFGFANATGTPDGQVMGNFMLRMEFPAPTITLKEGDEFYLSLSNVGMVMRPDLFDPHSVHYHGFPNASAIFDGLPDSGIAIKMGSTLTYYYNNVEPGTFLYHCHVEATEHMQMGMLGNLYVEAAQDGTPIGGFTSFAYNDGDGSTGYDVDYPVQIHNFDPNFHDASLGIQPLPFAAMEDLYPMFNGRGYPDTVNTADLPNSESGNFSQKVDTLITATQGQRILLRISSLSTTSFHTLTTSGIPMLVVGKDARKLGPPGDTSQYLHTNSITIGGGEAVDVILDTSVLPNPGPGATATYFLYTSNLDHLNNYTEEFGGMMTEIRITGI
jgi:FtsP/CotA-like multicopper oxidase with cupredoxin domain